jgi:hypothetical protein
MTKNLILPPVNFAATIAEILEDYLPEDCLIHTLTDQQVSDMYNDLVAGCEEAYEEASEKAEEAIERVYMQEAGEYRGIDPYDLPEGDEAATTTLSERIDASADRLRAAMEACRPKSKSSEKTFCATEVLQEAMSDMKNADVEADDNEVPIKYIYR